MFSPCGQLGNETAERAVKERKHTDPKELNKKGRDNTAEQCRMKISKLKFDYDL